jgi:hypothetical protein
MVSGQDGRRTANPPHLAPFDAGQSCAPPQNYCNRPYDFCGATSQVSVTAFLRSALPIVGLGFALVVTAVWIGLLGYGVFELAVLAL